LWCHALEPDFLRHIVNPMVDDYVARGLISPKDAIEVKRRVFQAEARYGFSVYGGSLDNLAKYLASRDFEELVEFLRGIGALQLALDLLSAVEERYSSVEGVVKAARAVRERILQAMRASGEVEVAKKCLGIEELSNAIREKLEPLELSVDKNAIRALLKGDVEVVLSFHKKHIKVTFKFKRGVQAQIISTALKRVASLVEEAMCI
jgi:hypothetical protein